VRIIILKNPQIDIRYIQRWLKEFDASSDKKDFLRTFEGVWKELESQRVQELRVEELGDS